MKLTILGNNGPFPASGGACSGYLLESKGAAVLIDCGTGVLANLVQNRPVNTLNAIILSHLHYDHMSDMLPMQYALQFTPSPVPIPVYVPRTPECIRTLLDAGCYELRSHTETAIGDMKVTFFSTKHPVETSAVRVENDGKCFVFTGDTNMLPGLTEFCSNADLLLADAGLNNTAWNVNAPHLSAGLCGVLARDSGAKKLMLTHFNPIFDKEQLLAEAKVEFSNTFTTKLNASYDI